MTFGSRIIINCITLIMGLLIATGQKHPQLWLTVVGWCIVAFVVTMLIWRIKQAIKAGSLDAKP